MKTKTINLFSFDELAPEAQKKAHADYRTENTYFFLSHELNERLHELLEENGIKDNNNTSRPGTEPTPVLYSLSSSQGDGVMFAGDFEFQGHALTVKHEGHYYHSMSKQITWHDFEGEDKESQEEKIASDFEEIYQKICKQLESYGYEFIEHEDSLEAFQEACEGNDYTFREDGTMEDIA